MIHALASILRSYNILAGKASSVTNQLVATSGAAKTSMQELAFSLSTVLPVASVAEIGSAEALPWPRTGQAHRNLPKNWPMRSGPSRHRTK